MSLLGHIISEALCSLCEDTVSWVLVFLGLTSIRRLLLKPSSGPLFNSLSYMDVLATQIVLRNKLQHDLYNPPNWRCMVLYVPQPACTAALLSELCGALAGRNESLQLFPGRPEGGHTPC